jgi:HK97 family phage prohead protease
MPYFITDTQPDCSGWATVKEETDGSLTTIGCHATKQDAIDQMVAVSIAENMDPGGEWNPAENRVVNLELPAYIKNAAARGIEHYENGLGGDGLVERTIREARQMARGEITSDKVIRANAWGARHKVDLAAPQNSNADSDEFPGNGAVAFYLWGIDPLDPEPAMSWFERKSNEIKNEERSESSAIQQRVSDTLFHMDEKGLETRRITLNDFELRAAPEGDGMTFSGYAAVFNSESEPLPFRERIMPGAFSKSLRSRNDIRMYLNHDTGRVLASRRAGTLRLNEDQHGLFVEADLPPTTDGRDLSILMKRGDVDSMSFGFSVPSGGDWWSEDGNTRELREIRLHEVSVVTGFPAYTATTASVRSLDELIATQGVDPSFVETAMMKLSNGESITADEASLISSIVYELTESPDQIDPAAGISDVLEPMVNPEIEDESPMSEAEEAPAKIEIEVDVTVRELQRRQRELDLLMRRV